jgi:putative transposase
MRKNRSNPNYKSKNHSKFMLTYHIIFVCKYRKKLLTKYGEDIKQIMFDISKKYDFEKTVPRNPRSL